MRAGACPPAAPTLNGEMAERLKAHAWKACVGVTLPRVRIPLSPPLSPCWLSGFEPLAQPRALQAFLRTLYRDKWVVEVRPPFGGPEQALLYLSRYTHRVAISNHRLVSFENGKVTLRWRDSAHGNQQKLLTLRLDEFLRRFLLHVLPRRFVRIRYFGFLAHRKRGALLPLCRRWMARPNPSRTILLSEDEPARSGWGCPRCGGLMRVSKHFSAAELRIHSPPSRAAACCHVVVQLEPLGRFGANRLCAPRRAAAACSARSGRFPSSSTARLPSRSPLPAPLPSPSLPLQTLPPSPQGP